MKRKFIFECHAQTDRWKDKHEDHVPWWSNYDFNTAKVNFRIHSRKTNVCP